ncbi:MAG: DUF255 domain-containing protein [Firmicutes bacterium]|nr:DUF255 domain-containing protein [Bacillota bacterium]
MAESEAVPAVAWYADPEQALEEAGRSGRPVFVFVFRPGCSGCRLMDQGTFPRSAVRQALTEWVPLRLTEGHPFTRGRGLLWFPELLALEPDGALLRRQPGYLPAAEFLPWLILVQGEWAMRREAYEQAAALFEQVITAFPASGWVPEAWYWLGAARHQATGQEIELYRPWRELRLRYPQSLWAHKVQANWQPPAPEAE